MKIGFTMAATSAVRSGLSRCWRTAAAAGLVGSIIACSANFQLPPPNGQAMVVSNIATHALRTLGPGDAAYRRLADWAAANRDGWTQFMGTPSASGTMVTYGAVSLQFVDHQVLTRAPAGIFEKTTPDDIAALLR